MFAEQALTEKTPLKVSSLFSLNRTTVFVYPAILFVALSLIALAVNHYFYQYPGNDYLRADAFLVACNVLLMYVGCLLLQGRNGKSTQIVKEVIYFVIVMALGCFATTAVQFTPFATIDQHILAAESFLHLDGNAMMVWAHKKNGLKLLLEIVYASLNYQMCFIPLVVIVAGRIDLIREYYFLLLTSALIGFVFYYFFPTTAPASVIDSVYFSEAQRATYLKFFQLHHYIQPMTMDGGLIALPSFHVIWAWLCLRLVREWSIAFCILLLINLLLVASCVLLGWHYCLDVVASVVVIFCVHALYRCCVRRDEF